MSMRRSVSLVLALVLCAFVGTADLASGQTPTTAGTTSVAGSRAATAVTKLLVVVVENHSLSQMRTGMPYTFGLAQRYGYATDYHALRHPSLPNYIAIAGGDMYGIHDDKDPSVHPITRQSVFGQARRHGKMAGVYAESMSSPCQLTSSGRYAVKHNPWAYFVNNRVGCKAADRPIAAFAPDVSAGRLPRVGMVVPNLCHDAHNCSLATADAWFKQLMGTVYAGPDWKSGRLAVVLTADEDDHTQGNTVLTVVIHPSQDHHVVTTRLTHYSLTRLYDEVAGLPYLRNAATAPSMATAFGLPLG
jgi:acid phosphatase